MALSKSLFDASVKRCPVKAVPNLLSPFPSQSQQCPLRQDDPNPASGISSSSNNMNTNSPLIKSPRRMGPFGHFHLVLKPNSFRDALQNMGALYDELGTNTVAIQPLPSFLTRFIPEANNIIYTKDENLIKHILKNEDKYPRRAGYLNDNIQAIQSDLGIGTDLFSTDGPEWHAHRKLVQKHLLSPEEVKQFTHTVTQVARDYVQLIHQITSKNEGFMDDLKFRNTCFTFESTVALLYGVRNGTVTQDSINDHKFHNYANSFVKLFETFQPLSFCPVHLMKSVGRLFWYNEAKRLYDNTLVQSRQFAESAMQASADSKCVWAKVLKSATDADEEKLKCNLSAVLSGGLDTTATQLLWTMQALAEFPEEQEKLSRQIRDNLGSEPIDHDNVHRVGLARAVIKEAQRLYPLVGFFPRQPYTDVNYSDSETGHSATIPAGSLILIDNFNYSRDEKYFPEPLVFRPERWMREDDSEHFNKDRMFLAFGSGPRSCIGRRISELEMRIFIIELIRNFRLDLEGDAASPIYSGIVIPDKTPKIRFTPRN